MRSTIIYTAGLCGITMANQYEKTITNAHCTESEYPNKGSLHQIVTKIEAHHCRETNQINKSIITS